VAPEGFESRIRRIFFDLQREWNGVPFEVANDGEVTALAGSMSLGQNAVLGLAMGTSEAGGYVTRDGRITSWLNELAFVPVDYAPEAPVDEWSGDRGCGALYFSQQAVGRWMRPAGIESDPATPLPEKLKKVQALMDRGFGAWLTASQAIGYAELAEYLDGRLSLDEAVERTVKRTRELARRQMAWFRRDPRIRWFDAGAGGAPEVADDIRTYLGSA
jgi:hypothetical protein